MAVVKCFCCAFLVIWQIAVDVPQTNLCLYSCRSFQAQLHTGRLSPYVRSQRVDEHKYLHTKKTLSVCFSFSCLLLLFSFLTACMDHLFQKLLLLLSLPPLFR